ncbi:MAG: excinuclease ABC subunit UvrA [Candidatus Jacksonbacteria bacterium]|nr:excinuclease ABC subunit UvrA [Candidatus Jacksonbacteria bacterium]MBT6301474.1 excinuclease ABC subunit UvrA [Candidatus Jacksonbacteria bacterium]MBT6757141.1 excinuclease ABC subunit UvrA [Candidatus Jacksonbacteria bacterium]MBT6955353.1 excinuclease ABC subunit UvrA [Candidatus Jacksonbacteria bacterium]MBT7008530.1 excinuclease ABC subunit UvrA [Candidatus Jacksonbacteria bacterium]
MAGKIHIKGARVHNLKNITVDIPRDKLVVITGLSGSGKSSLAFDTIYAEGQRRYVESLSAYARQFLGLMDKPDVDQIDGLSPAIAIDQKTASHNPRSTVGTVTEIYDYLRLLFARVGVPHCPISGEKLEKQTIDQITDKVLALPSKTAIAVVAPVIRDQKGEHKRTIEEMQKAGYARVRIDGSLMMIDEAEDIKLDPKKKHTIDVVVDRLIISAKTDKARLTDSLETALDLGDGLVIVLDTDTNKEFLFSQHYYSPHCEINLPELEPRHFSFNSPHGACEECGGLGSKLEVDSDFIVPNKKLTIAEGAIRPWARSASHQTWYTRILAAVAEEYGFDLNTPYQDLKKKDIEILLNGSGNKQYKLGFSSDKFSGEYATSFEGIIPNLERRYKETDSDYIRREIEGYMRIIECPVCHGKRLRKDVWNVTVGGWTITEIVTLPINECLELFQKLSNPKKKTKKSLDKKSQEISRQILKEIIARLSFLDNVGISYLTLDRSASTLSGGESQRIRLATQIGSGLSGVIYILDEPSIGLHQRDNDRLIKTLKNLRDLGNTVIVVEHDEDTIRASDHVIDIGPGAGAHGGKIVAQGTPAQIEKKKDSLTGAYMSGKESIPSAKKKREGNGKTLTIKKAEEHNLQGIHATIPLGQFVCVTGVSGSGKSTLVTDILAKALRRHFHRAKDRPGKHEGIDGLEHLDKVIEIDQSPIGRTPRSNPATYTGLFTPIRDLFAQTPEAKIRGYRPGRFSFNVKGGRCEACQGDGLVKIEMHFLPDVYVECEECSGRRYNQQVLDIHYKGKNISDVLHMTVEQAHAFFRNIPPIANKLKTLEDVGLGYIQLGQSATTLSGGEAQRIKLASELSRRATGKTLYILDEPTTGLHFEDVKRLLMVLNRLVDKGNSILVIEHNLDVVKSADWIIDLGPDGGDKGGFIVAEGRPKDIIKQKKSYTGQYLKRMFE